MNHEKQANYRIALVLALLAALCRLAPHPMNFTPALAVALFGNATLPRRLAYAVPLGAMLLSDFALGYGWMNLVVDSCFLTGARPGSVLRENRTLGRTVAATPAGSSSFYVVTNFAVRLGPPMPPPYNYPSNFAGPVKCYVMGLPFFRNALAGDVCRTLGSFALFDAARWWTARRKAAFNGSIAA